MNFIDANFVFGVMLLSFYSFFYEIKIKESNVFFIFLLLLNPAIRLLISFEIIISFEKENIFYFIILFSFLLAYLFLKIFTYGQTENEENDDDYDEFW